MLNDELVKLIYNKNNFIKILILCILAYIIYLLYYKFNKINEGFVVTTPSSALFTSTGSVQQGVIGNTEFWTVPPGVTSAKFTVIGGKGSDFEAYPSKNFGGRGAKITLTTTVIPGDRYAIGVANDNSESRSLFQIDATTLRLSRNTLTGPGMIEPYKNTVSSQNAGTNPYENGFFNGGRATIVESGGGGAATTVFLMSAGSQSLALSEGAIPIVIAGGGGGAGYELPNKGGDAGTKLNNEGSDTYNMGNTFDYKNKNSAGGNSYEKLDINGRNPYPTNQDGSFEGFSGGGGGGGGGAIGGNGGGGGGGGGSSGSSYCLHNDSRRTITPSAATDVPSVLIEWEGPPTTTQAPTTTKLPTTSQPQTTSNIPSSTQLPTPLGDTGAGGTGGPNVNNNSISGQQLNNIGKSGGAGGGSNGGMMGGNNSSGGAGGSYVNPEYSGSYSFATNNNGMTSVLIDWTTPKYIYKGCYNDKTSHALPRKINSNVKVESVDECYELAKINYDVFGLQNGGECWAGNKATDDYTKYGYSTLASCNILGNRLTNQVYEVYKAPTTTKANVFATSPNYNYKGCYNDEINNPALPEYYDTPATSVDDCYNMMKDDINYDVFALQYGGECWAGNKTTDSYDKYGKLDGGCDNILGNIKKNQVYEVIRKPTTTQAPTTTKPQRTRRATATATATTAPLITISETEILPEIATNLIDSQQILNNVKKL